MIEAPSPPNEAERLAALRALTLLDTPSEERFDHLTRYARQLFEVPIALISLTDEHRQWFKSRAGLDALEIPRLGSFCSHAILEAGPFVVPDATRDPRFADNPLVTGPLGIRFYAALPLLTPSGHRIGTICVLDRRPRTFGVAEQEHLRSLAFLVEREIGAIELQATFRRLEESEARQRSVLAALEEGVAVYDPEGRILSCNPGAERILDVPRERLVGSTLLEQGWRVIREDGSACPPDELPFRIAMRTGLPCANVVLGLCRPREEPLWLLIHARPLFRNEDDSPHAAVSSFLDVTQRRRAERALEEARLQALQASQAKTDFLASMSHELRTPLSAIVGTIDLLWESPASEEQRLYLEVGRRASATLMDLIDDVLDLAKVEAGRMELEEVPFALAEAVESAVAVAAFRAREKGLDLRWEAVGPLPPAGRGDPTRLRQVLVNLLGNAVKFTERGEVVLRLARAESAPDRLHFSVRDTGMGVPADRLETIFESFTQAEDAATTRSFGGTGLGLAISRQLVERMGGRIWAERGAEGGTIFHFTLPLAPALPSEVPAPEAPREPASGPPLRVLLVDDSKDNRMLLQTLLAKAGHAVETADEGRSAVARFLAGTFDVVVMDMQMPILDGYAATRAIRAWELEQGRPTTPILALTANAFAEDRRRCLEVGCSDYMSKPFERASILSKIADLGRAPRPAKPADPGPEAPQAPDEAAWGEVAPDILHLLPGYLGRQRESVTLGRTALAAGDLEALRVLGHDWKGTGALYGVARLSPLGEALERAARAADLAASAEAMEAIARCVDSLRLPSG